MTFFQITCDNEIIYDIRSKDRIVTSPKMTLEVGKNGSLSFIIPQSNPGYSSVKLRKSVIEVFQITKKNNKFYSELWFRGIAYSSKKDFWKRKQVECEGELSFFNDSIVRPYSYQGSVENLFKQYVNEHNAQVDDYKKFIPRNCTVIDNNDYITRANENYPSSKEEMNDKLLNLLGGHFETEKVGDTIYIDYLAEYDKYNSQAIVFGRNQLDLSEFIKTDDIVTRLIGLGVKNEDTGAYLKFDSINDGKDYVEDTSAIALFGLRTETVEFEDVIIAENLLTKTRKELENRIQETVTIELSAADLHYLDVEVESLRVGRMTRVVSIPHGLDKYFLLSKMSINLDDPKSTQIVLGATYKTLTEKQVEQEKKSANDLKNILSISDTVKATAKDAKSTATTANTTANEAKTIANTANGKVDGLIADIPEGYVSAEVFNTYKTFVLDTFLKISDANSTYAKKSVLNDYLKEVDADNKYALITSLSNYLTTINAENTYLKITDATTEYAKKNDFEDLVRRVEVLENGGAE